MTSEPTEAGNHLKPTHIHVTFTIVTPDQLRKIIFTLSKTTDANDDSWSIMFELDERADANGKFQLVIQLQVDVDHNDSAKAAATAKNGMDPDQRAQALVAGDTAKDVKTGDASKEDLQADTKAIVSVRDDNSPN
jgi:hypothetical protein